MKKPQKTAIIQSQPNDQWPASDVSMVRLADITAYARNARTHSPAQVAKIAASVREWGWTNPVLLDEEGGLIARHGRVEAERLGETVKDGEAAA